MEWYMRRGGDEMLVPQDQEQSEQDNSFHWDEGLSMCGKIPVTNYDIWDSDSRVVGDWLDYQLDGMNEMDQMNDNFMTSFFEKDPPQMRNTYQSVGVFPGSNCNTTPFDNLGIDMSTDSQSLSHDLSPRGNLKDLEVPSSLDWDKLDDSPTYTPHSSKKSKGSLTRNAQVSEKNTSLGWDDLVDEDTSFEETALQELQVAMSQLTKETRNCFRDALYRLAKSSSKQQSENQRHCGEHTDKEASLSNVHGETSRFGELEQMNPETNYFDSTVAHLMFNELNRNTPHWFLCIHAEKPLQQSFDETASYNE